MFSRQEKQCNKDGDYIQHERIIVQKKEEGHRVETHFSSLFRSIDYKTDHVMLWTEVKHSKEGSRKRLRKQTWHPYEYAAGATAAERAEKAGLASLQVCNRSNSRSDAITRNPAVAVAICKGLTFTSYKLIWIECRPKLCFEVDSISQLGVLVVLLCSKFFFFSSTIVNFKREWNALNNQNEIKL